MCFVQTSLATVTGESPPFLGKTDIELCIGKQKVTYQFLTADMTDWDILVIDFLLAKRCDNVISKGHVILNREKSLCFLHRNSLSACRRIAVTETVTIPPETEMIIEGKPLDAIDKNCYDAIE